MPVPLPPAQECLVRDAVVAELNDPARPWRGLFTAAAGWLVEYEAEDLETLQVAVVAETVESERLVRGSTQSAYSVSVDFQRKVTPESLTEGDDACAVAQAVFDYYADKVIPLAGLPGWYVAGAQRDEVYSWVTLYSERVFDTAVILTVKGAR